MNDDNPQLDGKYSESEDGEIRSNLDEEMLIGLREELINVEQN